MTGGAFHVLGLGATSSLRGSPERDVTGWWDTVSGFSASCLCVGPRAAIWKSSEW